VILLFSHTVEEHHADVGRVFDMFGQHGIHVSTNGRDSIFDAATSEAVGVRLEVVAGRNNVYRVVDLGVSGREGAADGTVRDGTRDGDQDGCRDGTQDGNRDATPNATQFDALSAVVEASLNSSRRE